jgi:NAD(P)-dependent dehydrogenase (short-subunit alcohol dehydrogenase family)
MTGKRIALVTGGNRGIGFETCRQLAHAGLEVFLASRQRGEGEQAAQQLQAHGFAVKPLQLDVSDSDSVARCLAGLARSGVEIDVLINNAGVYPTTPITDASEQEFALALQVNLLGAWRMAKAVFPGMLQRGYGRIVNVSSGLGQMNQPGGPGAGVYGISKAALNALTLELANAARGDIKVNAMDPGWVATRMGGRGAPRKPEEASITIIWLATLPPDGPNGGFFLDKRPLEW